MLRTLLFGLALAFVPAAAPWAETLSSQPLDDSRPADLPPPLSPLNFPAPSLKDDTRVELGRLLFFDKVLSGNLNISCATCHHPLTHTTDGLSLPIGEGGIGLGVTRQPGNSLSGARKRVPRNSPALFNLGADFVRVLFHDGRIEPDPGHPSGFRSPAGDALPPGLDSILAAQAMFPVTSADEMAGHPGENSIANAAAAGNLAGDKGVWTLLAERLRANPDYVALFERAFPEITTAVDITFVHAANAIAAFQATAFRADDTPFDRWLNGDAFAMDGEARRGVRLFYGKAGCARCHAGPLLSDQSFHAIAMPQIGPGKDYSDDGTADYGRGKVSEQEDDRYRFRTPPLRNVALTGPWGHSGAYASLEAVVRHHLDPLAALAAYDPEQARLPSRGDLDNGDYAPDRSRWSELAAANELPEVALTDLEIADLLAFLRALTDPRSVDMSDLVPSAVPSGLPIYD